MYCHIFIHVVYTQDDDIYLIGAQTYYFCCIGVITLLSIDHQYYQSCSPGKTCLFAKPKESLLTTLLFTAVEFVPVLRNPTT